MNVSPVVFLVSVIEFDTRIDYFWFFTSFLCYILFIFIFFQFLHNNNGIILVLSPKTTRLFI